MLAFVDTETTGLDPDVHEIWEVGLIVDDEEHHWFLPVDLGRADPYALDIGGYHDRYPYGERNQHSTAELSHVRQFASDFAWRTRGRHLVGAVVSFDEERLRRLLRAFGGCPGWHYHLVDVENLAAGRLGLEPPWDSTELSMAVGVDPARFDRHTALGDARWAKAIYEAVTSPTTPTTNPYVENAR